LNGATWSGIVQVRLKSRNAVFYFDCVAHAMVRDDAVHGITILARDVTALRRNEARFTELFESLQEGIYIVTPEDRIVGRQSRARPQSLATNRRTSCSREKSRTFLPTKRCEILCAPKWIASRLSKAANHIDSQGRASPSRV